MTDHEPCAEFSIFESKFVVFVFRVNRQTGMSLDKLAIEQILQLMGVRLKRLTI